MAENNNLLEKLEGLQARFEEVSTLITDPSVIADQQRYVRLTKEYKDLEDLMNARKEYAMLLANLEESKDILSRRKILQCFRYSEIQAAICEVKRAISKSKTVPGWELERK